MNKKLKDYLESFEPGRTYIKVSTPFFSIINSKLYVLRKIKSAYIVGQDSVHKLLKVELHNKKSAIRNWLDSFKPIPKVDNYTYQLTKVLELLSAMDSQHVKLGLGVLLGNKDLITKLHLIGNKDPNSLPYKLHEVLASLLLDNATKRSFKTVELSIYNNFIIALLNYFEHPENINLQKLYSFYEEPSN